MLRAGMLEAPLQLGGIWAKSGETKDATHAKIPIEGPASSHRTNLRKPAHCLRGRRVPRAGLGGVSRARVMLHLDLTVRH